MSTDTLKPRNVRKAWRYGHEPKPLPKAATCSWSGGQQRTECIAPMHRVTQQGVTYTDVRCAACGEGGRLTWD